MLYRYIPGVADDLGTNSLGSLVIPALSRRDFPFLCLALR